MRNRSSSLIHLTKSLFIRGYDCPMRLRHALDGVPSSRDADEHLRMLAEGGFQFEKLVRASWPGETLHSASDDPAAAAAATIERIRGLLGGSGVLHEAVFMHGDFLARVDMLRIEGDSLLLCEIKAKAADGPTAGQIRGESTTDLATGMLTTRGLVASKWLRYAADVAFQTVVVERALAEAGIGDLRVTPRLVVANRNAVCGELDHFGNVRKRAEVAVSARLDDTDFEFVEAPPTGYFSPLVLEVDVATAVERLRTDSAESKSAEWADLNLEQLMDRMAAMLRGGAASPDAERGWKCKDCEFQACRDREGGSVESGFERCWGSDAFAARELLTLYRGRNYRPSGNSPDERWVEEVLRRHSDSEPLTIGGLPRDGGTGTQAATRNLQIQASRSGVTTTSSGFVASARKSLAEFPDGTQLRFIDFETATACLPYEPGMRPYEVVAFQFSSHSIALRGGKLDLASSQHLGWLDSIDVDSLAVRDPRQVDRDFVDALRSAIGDDGPVFHWSAHERTVLRAIADRLDAACDRERIDWIVSLTGVDEIGGRLIDMLRVAEGGVMSPHQQGRYSIKQLLPAACREDAVWRTLCELMDWSVESGLRVDCRDAYSMLPPLPNGACGDARFPDDRDDDAASARDSAEGIRCGTDAIRAFQQVRFGSTSAWGEVDPKALRTALEGYCRLDTAAMVAIWVWMVRGDAATVAVSPSDSDST